MHNEYEKEMNQVEKVMNAKQETNQVLNALRLPSAKQTNKHRVLTNKYLIFQEISQYFEDIV